VNGKTGPSWKAERADPNDPQATEAEVVPLSVEMQ